MENFTKIRHTLRGTKRCPSCGTLNGQRARICRNESCELRKKTLEMQHPFDPIQLVTYTEASLYSLRKKERDFQVRNRNFVQINDVTLALEENSTIVSRNAICFVDSCKYDPCDAANIACKHVKACTTIDASKQPLPQADIYTIVREVLWNLNIQLEQKQRLWKLYKEDEQQIPAIQRLNDETFAVKCVQSKIFPAGRLHVTAISNAFANKKVTHGCVCKKLKIIVEPDNSVVMQEDICDHLLLVLAAVLSKANGKNLYGNFLNSLKSFWMPTTLELPISEADATHDDAFFGMSINIGGNFDEGNNKTAADDIFIFGDEFLNDNNNIPDFSDIILDITTPSATSSVTSTQLSNNDANNTTTTTPTCCDFLHTGDPNLVSSCHLYDEDTDMQFNDASSVIAADVANDVTTTHLELSDCNIELMDQFQLTDQIDLCSDDHIALPSNAATELFDVNSISILSSSLCGEQLQPVSSTTTTETPVVAVATAAAAATAATTTLTAASAKTLQKNSASLLKSNQLISQMDLPATIEMPTIAVVKKCPVKASAIVAEVKTRKFPYLPAKRALIVNTAQKRPREVDIVCDKQAYKDNDTEAEVVSATTEPALAYSTWLEFVIETINGSIEVVDKTDVAHSFHVHAEIFAHFSKSFSIGIKRRIPNLTAVVKTGRHKGLIKYTWYFTTASTVRRIFTTKNICIELERAFECAKDGSFIPYVRRIVENINDNGKCKRIYPKLALYFAHIWFDCNSNNNSHHKTGLKVEWLPNAFPKSHFGILNIEFSLGIKKP